MSKFNGFEGGFGETLTRLLEQAKEMSSKPVENISDAVSEAVGSKSVAYMEDHYAVTSKEEIETMISLLKDQEEIIERLSKAADASEEKIESMQAQLRAQEALLEGQLKTLKDSHDQCALELKEIISRKETAEVDYTELEGAVKTVEDSITSQQRAHTVEIDRMVMGLRTSLEKEIEKSNNTITKRVDTSIGTTQKVTKVTLALTLVNMLILVGYVIYSLVF